MGFDERGPHSAAAAIATISCRLRAALHQRVMERFPSEQTRWPLVSQAFNFRPYLVGQERGLPRREDGADQGGQDPVHQDLVPTGTMILALDPILGSAIVGGKVWWLPVGRIDPPADLAMHDTLCTFALVPGSGAFFVLPLSALHAPDGEWIQDPVVVRQIEFNIARHRKLLGPDPEAVRKATVRPARVAEVLGIHQNALANGVERAVPDGKYARLVAGRTEGGFTFESVEMTAAEWGVGLQDAMDRLARLRTLRKEIEAQIEIEATGTLTAVHRAPVERDAALSLLVKAGKVISEDGPRR
jgi:hypothetical protein